MNSNKILGIGEILIRLTAPNYKLFSQTDSLNFSYGGAELNVIASLSKLGINTAMMSKIPQNDLGEAVLSYVKSFGIDTTRILQSDDRIGIYFSQTGFAQRPTKIIYDRKESAFSKIKLKDYDLERVFNDISWIHISGITPADCENTYQFTKEVIALAKKQKIKISFDINWRSSLWNINDAVEKFSQLIQGVDLCIGIGPIKLNYDSNGLRLLRQESYEYYQEICKQLASVYQVKHVAFTSRDSLAMNKNRIKSFYFDSAESKLYETPYSEVDIIDRIGTGDAFTAGVLYGLLTNKSSSEILDFAHACFILKHSIFGDVNILSLEDIEQFNNNKLKAVKIIR